jgi:acetyl-CoA carboxylase carboxyltransferase component
MGGNQAADTLLSLKIRDAEKSGKPLTPEAIEQLREAIRSQYQSQTDIRYGAARGWVDAIVAPDQTRRWLSAALSVIRDENRMGSRYMAREI